MLVTEAEASARWCPEVRLGAGSRMANGVIVVNSNTPVCNRVDIGENTAAILGRCVGSMCMMWRWMDSNNTSPNLRRGYCGLAGGIRETE